MGKQPERIKENCPLLGTEYCRLLNMKGCGGCTVAASEDWEGIKSDLEQYQSLLPEGGVAQLFQSPHCQFCKGEHLRKRSGYAILDMAHPQPKRIQKHLLFGKRVRAFGTMIPVQLSICSKCRRRLLWVEHVPLLLPLAVGGGMLALLSLGSFSDRLADIHPVLPFVAWLAVTLAAWLGGVLWSRLAAKSFSAEMYVNVLDHPTLKRMLDMGWFPITRQSRTNVIFSKSRLGRGLGTATDDAVQEK